MRGESDDNRVRKLELGDAAHPSQPLEDGRDYGFRDVRDSSFGSCIPLEPLIPLKPLVSLIPLISLKP